MTHSVQHMIALQYREKPRSKTWRTAYRMHVEGLDNMKADAKYLPQCVQCVEWKIVKEEVATGAVVETLARQMVS